MGGDAKCTFGTRMAIDIHMLNEIIYREVKHFRNYKIYRPNFGSIPVTGKFYAAHDQLKAESEEQTKKVDDYYHNVAQTRAKGPQSKYPSPATENQEYGWYTTPLVKMNRSDKRFYQPKKESENTKIEIVILMSNPKSKKSK
uniref:Protein FAM183A n=1 Tax=Bombyx mori TaxID=7091 RepID=A0A8R2DL06_BOMMO|nr:protein FAM183A-like [Bombyx mori]